MIIDPKCSTPIYRQIAEQIRAAIDAGVYRPGEVLPSLRALAVDIRVNPNTVQRAYEELERAGVVQSRRGLGIFVLDQTSRTARGKREKETLSSLRESVSAGLDADISPARLRELFEVALHTAVNQARRQR